MTLLATVFAFLLASCGAPNAPSDPKFDQHIPSPGSVVATQMALQTDPKAVSLMQKSQAAMEADEVWARAFLASIPPGKPMPYHPKLGISREEHAFVISSLQSNTKLRPVRKVDITFMNNDDGSIDLKILTAGLALKSARISSDQKFVLMNGEKLPFLKEIKASESAGGAAGPWDGLSWDSDENLTNGSRRFSIGRTVEGNRIIYLVYSVQQDYLVFLF